MSGDEGKKIVHKHQVNIVQMPLLEIKPGKKYLLGIDPDQYDQAVLAEIHAELMKSFPESRFVLMAGLYSVNEAPDQGD